MSLPRIIVTADDFGLDAASNRAIIDVLSSGIVSHTSILTNMPGFDEACELVHNLRLSDRVGVHLNLTQGKPLTDKIRQSASFCLDGEFAPPSRWKGFVPLRPDAKRALAAEVRAQIATARARGLHLTHLDSHNDIHIEPNIAGAVAAIAIEVGISRLRPARNCGKRQGAVRRIWNRLYNTWLRGKGLKQVRYFGTIEDVVWLAQRRRIGPTMSAEVMTHPSRSGDGAVVDAPFDRPLVARILEMRAYFESDVIESR